MLLNLHDIDQLIRDESISAYTISKNTGLNHSVVTKSRQKMKAGRPFMDSLSIKSAKSLQHFIDLKNNDLVK